MRQRRNKVRIEEEKEPPKAPEPVKKFWFAQINMDVVDELDSLLKDSIETPKETPPLKKQAASQAPKMILNNRFQKIPIIVDDLSDEYVEKIVEKSIKKQASRKARSEWRKPQSFFRKERFYDTDNPQINPKFNKKCGCPAILIVDDQYINRFIIQEYCAKYKVPCMDAEDGKEAIEKTKEIAQKSRAKGCCRGFRLILMDLNMPVLGGIEATQQIVESKNRFEVDPDLAVIGKKNND